MAVYLVRRLLFTVSVVTAVSVASFVGFALSFDPAFPLVFNYRAHQFVVRYYHLNGPVLARYWYWLTGFFHHGFGSTVSTDVGGVPLHFISGGGSPGQAIGPIVWRAAANTAELVGAALVLVVVGSVLVGTIAARRRRWRADISLRALAYLGASVPTFLVGDLLLRAILPHASARYYGGRFIVSSTGSWLAAGPPTGGFVGWFRHMTLPALTLALGLIGIYARHVRSAMLVSLQEPYVTVARAKGLRESRVVVRHALRNSLIPFTALLSLEIGGVIGASLAADGVFDTGGLASTFLSALAQADPFFMTALFVVTSVVVCVFTFVGDALVGVLDPRIRREG